MISNQAIAEYNALKQNAGFQAELEDFFFKTDTYRTFRSRLYSVLEAREQRLKRGLTEQKGGAIIGPSGSGKSRMVKEAIQEFRELAEATGGREFGHRVVSVVVPGRATPNETAKAILRRLDYSVSNARDDDYLFERVKVLMKQQRVAGLHLDEVQDAGRYETGEAMSRFAKRFRNMTQDDEWPVCLFLSATLQGREFINHDHTLTRRLRPIEIRPISLATDGRLLREAVETLLEKSQAADNTGLMQNDEFIQVLMHAAAYRFGLAIEITIEAIGEALFDGVKDLDLDHFAGAYFTRTGCDDDMNPFITQHWRGIDTTKALDSSHNKEPDPPKKGRSKK